MAELRASMATFAAGEIGEDLAARIDVAKYHTALKAARNVVVRASGGVWNRQGFEYVCELYDSTQAARLIPFKFSEAVTYVLPFENQTARVISKGGVVLETEIIGTGISNALQAVVTVPNHPYVVGDDLYFQGVSGMVEINGNVGRVLSVPDVNSVIVSLDSRRWGVFTGWTGGIAGASYVPPPVTPPAPPPHVDPPPPPVAGGDGGGKGAGGGGGGGHGGSIP